MENFQGQLNQHGAMLTLRGESAGAADTAMLTRRLARLRPGIAKGHRYVMVNLHKEDGVSVDMGGARMD